MASNEPYYTEEDLQQALAMVEKERMNLNQASKEYKVPYSTLHGHHTGKTKSSQRGRPSNKKALGNVCMQDTCTVRVKYTPSQQKIQIMNLSHCETTNQSGLA